jgi:hypothetical protein
MDALTWDSSCEDQPHGVIGIRDTSGLWLWTELEADCSGCGISTWDGSSESEELCIDLRSIKTTLDFLEEVDPWS